MENAGFQMVLLGVLFFYCWIIYHFRWQAMRALRSVLSMKSEEALSGDKNKLLYNRFVGAATVAGAVIVGVAVVKGWMALKGGWAFDGWWRASAVMAGGALGAICIGLFQFGVLKIAGKLTFTSSFVDALVRTKKTHFAAAAIILAPTILVFSGENPVRDHVLQYIFAFEVITIVSIFIGQTFILFVKQKVSVLVWFLYLCAVEIFPVSLAVMMAVKNV